TAGEVLERVAARIHDGDDDTGERLAEENRHRHGEQGDGVDADAAHEEVADNGNGKADDDGKGRRAPDQAGEIGPVVKIGSRTGEEAGEREREKRPVDETFTHAGALDTTAQRPSTTSFSRPRTVVATSPSDGLEIAAIDATGSTADISTS